MGHKWDIDIKKCELAFTDEYYFDYVFIRILPKDQSYILDRGFVRLEDLPLEWYEIDGFRIFSEKIILQTNVDSFCEKILKLIFLLTNNKSIIWRCSREHALYTKFYFDNYVGYDLSFVGGTLADRTVIIDFTGSSGGSEDEQILMLSPVNGEKI